MLDTTDLELLIALADSGHLGKTAARLGTHHATAFRRLQSLEERWGTRLFERLPQGYVPTTAGEAALVQARAIRISLINLEGSLHGRDARPEGRVVVTTSDGLGAAFVPRLLAQVGERYREITLELRIDNQVTDLTEREVDIAIRPARKLTGQLTGRRVAQLAFALYATPGYLARHPPLDRAAPNFAGHRLCQVLAPMTHYSVGEWLVRQAKTTLPGFASNQFVAMQGWAQAGGGLVVLPCILGDQSAGLTRATEVISAMTVGLWLCTHPHIRKVARVRAVLDTLGSLIADELPALRGTAPESGKSAL